MQLMGHSGDVTTSSFNPEGSVIASGSLDRTILLWRTYGECENYMMIRGHKNGVLELHWFPSGDHLVSSSADKTVRCWDAHAGVQVKRLNEHKAIVNSCCPLKRGPQLFVSGADDGSIKVSLSQSVSLSTKYF
jgi:Prp8 binding protein